MFFETVLPLCILIELEVACKGTETAQIHTVRIARIKNFGLITFPYMQNLVDLKPNPETCESESDRM